MNSDLTARDLERFQQALLARETQLRTAVTQRPEPAEADDSDARLERNLHELCEIGAALERIDAGIYGCCLRCGKPMDRARLELFPAARFDMCCMENEEIEHEAGSAPVTAF